MTLISSQEDGSQPLSVSEPAVSPIRRASPEAAKRSDADITALLDAVSSEPHVIDRLGRAIDELRLVCRAKLELQQLTPQELRAGLEARTRILRVVPDGDAATGGVSHP